MPAHLPRQCVRLVRQLLWSYQATCGVLCSYNQVGANTFNSLGMKWLTACPSFLKLNDDGDDDERVSASQMPENADSC